MRREQQTTTTGGPSWDAIVALMDDEIREAVHRDLAPATEQAFLAEYCRRHMEKYGEEFKVN